MQNWQNRYMEENITPNADTPEPAVQMEQLSQADSLVFRGVDDALDEGYTAPEKWSAAQGFGNTPAEMKQGENLEQRILQEEPEDDPNKLKGPWNPTRENRQVGSQRAGRLVAPGSAGHDDAGSVASDVGISGGAASAEEAAMHVISEHDLADPGDDEDS